MRTFSVVLDRLPPRELRPNSRASWQAKLTPKAAERDAGFACARANWDGDAMRRAQLYVSVRHNRPLDLDNVLASLKAFFDGVVDAGVIIGDGPAAIPDMCVHWDGKGDTRIILQLREIP